MVLFFIHVFVNGYQLTNIYTFFAQQRAGMWRDRNVVWALRPTIYLSSRDTVSDENEEQCSCWRGSGTTPYSARGGWITPRSRNPDDVEKAIRLFQLSYDTASQKNTLNESQRQGGW